MVGALTPRGFIAPCGLDGTIGRAFEIFPALIEGLGF
jgi:hypothetical protein